MDEVCKNCEDHDIPPGRTYFCSDTCEDAYSLAVVNEGLPVLPEDGPRSDDRRKRYTAAQRQEAVVLVLVDGLTQQEAVRRTGASTRAVWQWIKAARKERADAIELLRRTGRWK